MSVTTIEINAEDLPVWRRWCKAKSMTSKELFAEFVRQVKLKKQAEFYGSLQMPGQSSKRLSGVKIDKNYRKNVFVQ